MAADALLVTPSVTTVVVPTVNKVTMPTRRVASVPCPSLGSHSISAVAPDTNLKEGTALAAA